jgi:hypothetical protein
VLNASWKCIWPFETLGLQFIELHSLIYGDRSLYLKLNSPFPGMPGESLWPNLKH